MNGLGKLLPPEAVPHHLTLQPTNSLFQSSLEKIAAPFSIT